jgi:multidrug efflux pump subunit AcrB
MHGRSDAEIIQTTHNTARFFTETRHIAWVLLIATMVWGVYGYFSMPQRKDPDIPVRQALAYCRWPGASSDRIEALVTKRLEEEIAKNANIEKIESISRTSVSVVYITLVESVKDRGKEFDDIALKLNAIHDLPDNAGPIVFVKDFGDTAALMLTVASPRIDPIELDLRARTVQRAIEETRASAAATPAANPPVTATRTARPGTAPQRVTIVHGMPSSLAAQAAARPLSLFVRLATQDGVIRDAHPIVRPGFIGVDGVTTLDDDALLAYTHRFIEQRLRASEIHPDAWPPAIIRRPEDTHARLATVAADKYSYKELDDFTDLIARTLKTLPIVSKVDRSGLLDEEVYLEYSQERLASYGVSPSNLRQWLSARNITAPGGLVEAGGKTLTIDPSGEFRNERDIGDVLVPVSNGSGSLYLRDLVDIVRTYVSPPHFLNFYARRTHDGGWERTRAVTLAIQMRAGGQIAQFAQAVDAALADLRQRLPEDLVLARTSDQPLQVEENIDLFMHSLFEAVVLVVLVSLIGFWEWRSALLMALAIPITLAMTFGMMDVLGIDLQQVSIASLIIALGLLVDDPVVAGDAIKRDLAGGHPPVVAAWLGPTKLAHAILFATITNIVAYLPFLLLSGDTGRFLYSLPVVITCSLVASRIVSMTFIPLLGYYLLHPNAHRPRVGGPEVKPKREPTIEERRKSGFAARYYRVGSAAIAHRWVFLLASLLFLALGGLLLSRLKTQFFPQDDQYLSYVDVWLPEDAPLSSTREVVERVQREIQRVAAEYGQQHPDSRGQPSPVLRSLTMFIGGGGPRFWFSVPPEFSQVNYAQILIEAFDRRDTSRLTGPLQAALQRDVPGAQIDVRRLEVGPPVGIPVAVRISGEDIPTLRRLAGELRNIIASVPIATRTRDNWGVESFEVRLRTEPDRANLAGITNLDVAISSAAGMNGFQVSKLYEGDNQIPIIARMRMEERAQLGDIQSLYVYSSQGQQKVPLRSISTIEYDTKIEKLQRRNQFRTITVSAFPVSGTLPSEVLDAARPRIDAFARQLPPGYRLEIGGEYEEQIKGFKSLAIVMAISIGMIFLALVLQFQHAIKPFIVFAAIPYGMVGAIGMLWIMGAPFGFMAFLGVASLIGVIVSHIIVLFDFIEERHALGEPLNEALLDAGIVRLRPVLITVAATVIALIPLARNGGPLWQPMCYAQIGGLTVATVVTLLIVPVIYAVFVLDLKWVKWEETTAEAAAPTPAVLSPADAP